MKRYIFIIIFSLFVWYLVSNEVNNRQIYKTLKMSGDNCLELKSVIDYYEKGTLKYRAVKYLIENMSDHSYYNYRSSRQYNSLLKESARSKNAKPGIREKMIKNAWDSIQLADGYFDMRILPAKVDVKVISDDYLISHIESSFASWESPWASHLSFDDFCRYLLPYRVIDEPLEDWRTIIATRNPWLLELKNSGINAFEACCIINDSLKNWITVSSVFDFLPRQSISDLFFSHVGNCFDMSVFTTLVMRTAGLPVASIRCPGGHAWNVLLDQDGILKRFYRCFTFRTIQEAMTNAFLLMKTGSRCGGNFFGGLFA